MADNVFDQFSPAATPAGAAPDGPNPFDQFGDASQPDTTDKPDPVLETVRELLKRGASSHDIHQYLQSVKRDNIPGVDNAASFIASNPERKNEVAVLGDGISSPKAADLGVVDATANSAADGAVAGFWDKIQSGLDTVMPSHGVWGQDVTSAKGVKSVWDGGSLADTYYHNLDVHRGESTSREQNHPVASLVGTAGGAIFSPINKIAAPLGAAAEGSGLIARAGAALAPDIAYGAAYGAGQSNSSTWSGQGLDSLEGAAGGAAGGALGHGIVKGVGSFISPAVDAGKKALTDAGVSITPMRMLGDVGAKAEDALGSVPFLGSVIRGGQERAGQEYVTGGVNKALEPLQPFKEVLEPLQKKLPEQASGNEAMTYLNDVYNAAYAKARAGMVFAKDDQFGSDLSNLTDRIRNGGADSLIPQYRKQFIDVVKGTVERRLGEDGAMAGDTLKKVLSSIDKKASGYRQAFGDVEKQDFGNALTELSAIIDNAARRNPASDPAAVALMDAADKGYPMKVILEKAGSTLGTEPGSFSPRQLMSAVKSNDGTVRKGNFNRGNALMQDYAQAGIDNLSPKIGNSGTTDRYMWAKALGLAGVGGAAGTASGYGPQEGAGAGIGIPLATAALAAPLYSRGGNAFLRKAFLASRGPGARLVGEKINSFAPYAGRLAAGASLARMAQGSANN